MSVPNAMLALLHDGPSHGFEIKRRYDALLGHGRELKFGQVYATLARLERDGLASAVGLAPGEGAERRIYAITDAGVSELDAWLEDVRVVPQRPSELFARVVLALASGHDAERVIDRQRQAALARVRELTAARRSGDVIDRLAADHEIVHLEADLRWIELAAARIEDLTRRVREAR